MSAIVHILGLAVCGGLCVVALWSAVRTSRRRSAQIRRVETAMRGRPPLTHGGFGKEFFAADEAAVAARVRATLQDCVGVNLSGAVPEDRLVEDVGLGDVDGLAGMHLIRDLQDEFHVTFEEPSSIIVTLGELVQFVATQLRRTSTGRPATEPTPTGGAVREHTGGVGSRGRGGDRGSTNTAET